MPTANNQNHSAMNILDEYRRNAQECQRMAEKAGNATDKASWLRLAASWLSMIKNNPSRFFGREPDTEEGTRESASHSWPDPSEKDSKTSH
jgi:hypothetical protein